MKRLGVLVFWLVCVLPVWAQYPVSEYPVQASFTNGGGCNVTVTVWATSMNGSNYWTNFKIAGTLTNGYVYVHFKTAGMSGWAEAVAKGNPTTSPSVGSWQSASPTLLPRNLQLRIQYYGTALTPSTIYQDVDLGTGTQKKKISLSTYANDTGKPLRVDIVDAAGNVVGSKYIQPGDPAWAGQVEIPVSAVGPFKVNTYLEGVQMDGPTLVDYRPVEGQPTPSVLVSSQSVSEANIGNTTTVPKPDVLLPPKPGAVSPNVWDGSTDTGTALTNQTFKQGMDKIAAALGRSGGAGDDTQAAYDGETITEPEEQELPEMLKEEDADQVLGLQSVVPTLATIIGPTTQVWTFGGSFDFFGHSTYFGVDLQPWSDAISIFRAICQAVLLVAFGFLAVSRIQKAFAG